MADAEAGMNGVSVGATLAFFRAHGLDKLVDAYNLHTYPWSDGPGEKASAIHRLRRLRGLVNPVCLAGWKALLDYGMGVRQ